MTMIRVGPSPAQAPLPRPRPPRHRRRPLMASPASSSNGGPKPPVVLGCGAVSADYLATVASFPNPDDMIRSLTLKVQGARQHRQCLDRRRTLGSSPQDHIQVSNDPQGRNILKELQADEVAEEGNSPFTYIIVDNQTKTRTCIHNPVYPPMVPKELTEANLFAALDSADIVYFDVRLHETALVVAEEASQRKLLILIDAERKRDGLDGLLNFASYVVCSAKFPQSNLRISANGVGSISGRLLLGTAKIIPSEELVDTTGAGDAFIRAVLYDAAFCSTGGKRSIVLHLSTAVTCNFFERNGQSYDNTSAKHNHFKYDITATSSSFSAL